MIAFFVSGKRQCETERNGTERNGTERNGTERKCRRPSKLPSATTTTKTKTITMKREAVVAVTWIVVATLARVGVAINIPPGEVGTWQMQPQPGDYWQHDEYVQNEDGTFTGSGFGDTALSGVFTSYTYTYYGDTVSSVCNEYGDGVVIHAVGFWLSETITYADGTTSGNSYGHKDLYCVYRHLDPETGLVTAYRYKMSTEQPMSFEHGECPAQAIDAFNNGIPWMTTGVTHLSDVVWKCVDNCKPFVCSNKKSPAVIIGATVGGLAAILITTVLVMLYRHGKLRCLTREGVSEGVTVVAEKSKKQVRHAKARMMLGSTTTRAHNRRRAAKRQMTNTRLDPAAQSEEGRSAANTTRTSVRPNVVPVRREQPVIPGPTSPAPTVIVVQQQQPAQQTVSANTNENVPSNTDEGAN